MKFFVLVCLLFIAITCYSISAKKLDEYDDLFHELPPVKSTGKKTPEDEEVEKLLHGLHHEDDVKGHINKIFGDKTKSKKSKVDDILDKIIKPNKSTTSSQKPSSTKKNSKILDFFKNITKKPATKVIRVNKKIPVPVVKKQTSKARKPFKFIFPKIRPSKRRPKTKNIAKKSSPAKPKKTEQKKRGPKGISSLLRMLMKRQKKQQTQRKVTVAAPTKKPKKVEAKKQDKTTKCVKYCIGMQKLLHPEHGLELTKECTRMCTQKKQKVVPTPTKKVEKKTTTPKKVEKKTTTPKKEDKKKPVKNQKSNSVQKPKEEKKAATPAPKKPEEKKDALVYELHLDDDEFKQFKVLLE